MKLPTTSTAPSTPTYQRDAEPAGSSPTLGEVVAAMPAAVDMALLKVAPERYTPKLAASIAEGAITRLTGTISAADGLAADGAREPDDDPEQAARIEGHVDRIMAALVEAKPEATA